MRLFLVSVMLAGVLSICKGQQEKSCNVFPKDLRVEVGSSVELVCQTSCLNNGNIFWTLNNEKISDSLSKTLNSTHTVLSLRNFNQSQATVQCHTSFMDQILGGVTVRTYSKPKNISCLFDYYSSFLSEMDGTPERFTCTWEHEMKSSQTINYTVNISPLKEKCNSQVAKCTIEDGRVSTLFFERELTINVSAKTAAWEVDSENYTFITENIVKIHPPTGIVTMPSSDHLLVEWNTVLGNRICEVKYYKTSESNAQASKYLSIKELKSSAIIKEMESCNNYSILVRCAKENATWSDWSHERTVLTKLNKAHIRPQLWRKVVEQGKHGERKVHLMWKAIPPTCKEVLNYTIKVISYNNTTTTGNYTQTTCGSSSCDVDVDKLEHRIYLTISSNDVVLSESSVYVPAVGEMGLSQVGNIQAKSQDGVIQVSWDKSENPASSYMIDWTYDGVQYYWKESAYTNATLFDLLPSKPYNITVTPLFNDSTGRGMQANLICSSVRVPEIIAVEVVDTLDKSAYVKWSTKSQDPCSHVDTYVVFCESQGRPYLNVTLDGSAVGVWLKDLKPNTQYAVFVEAIGYNGTTMSKSNIFTTNRFDSKIVTTVTVYGGICFFLVLCLGLTCAIQWKKFKEMPVPNPRLSSVGKWVSHGHQKTEGFFRPVTDQIENQVIMDKTQREAGKAFTPVCIGEKPWNGKPMICNSSTNSMPESEHAEWFYENSETQLLPSPEASTVCSFSQSSPYRSQDSVEPFLGAEKPSKSDMGKNQEKTTSKQLYVSLNMFEQSDVR
ncbi:PREDICTED: interleukin-6 receptor subunit beta-like isoform X2 [Cyprinodon variegatus]|uniref:Interleukin-6 receptor subunit beta-like n=1 Tax=Cyprinodon variegatus TaxID=28743 RepID=A0A3Q2CB00_CYPVA|nr:PREDICTED: interleukin-6 receptor subunit beta-like isoform X2 [Cyprinodon variegatus]